METPELNWKEAVVGEDGQITVGWVSMPVNYWHTAFVDQLREMQGEIAGQWGSVFISGNMLTIGGVDPASVPLLKAYLAEVADHTVQMVLRQEREREEQQARLAREAEARAARNAELERLLRAD